MQDRFIESNQPLIQWSKIGQVRWFQGAQWLYEPAAVIFVPLLALIFGQLLTLPLIGYAVVRYSETLGSPITDPEGYTDRLQQVIFDDPLLLGSITLLSFGAMHLIVWLWIWIMERRAWWSIGLPVKAINGWSTALFQYGRGLLIGFGLQMATIGVLALLGMIEFETPFQGFQSIVLINVLFLFIAFVVQGAAEEVLTRGFIFQVVGRRYGIWLGVLVSSLIFMALHLFNPNTSLIAILNLFLAGLLFALYALNEGTIWGACAVHSIWNWTMGNLLGLEVSGLEFAADTAALIDLQETGPDNITGGAFGPEGGIVITIILLLTCGLLLFTYWRHQNANTASP